MGFVLIIYIVREEYTFGLIDFSAQVTGVCPLRFYYTYLSCVWKCEFMAERVRHLLYWRHDSPWHHILPHTTTRWVHLVLHRSFSEPFKTSFFALCCAFAPIYLGCVMEASSLNWRAEYDQLKMAQRLATQQVKVLRHVPYEERFHQLYLY